MSDKTRWSARHAPGEVLQSHLQRRHGKAPSWIEENVDRLRSEHQREHEAGRADHDLHDDLTL